VKNRFGDAASSLRRIISISSPRLAVVALAIAMLMSARVAEAAKPYNPFFGPNDMWGGTHAINQQQGYQGRQVIRPQGKDTCVVGCAATIANDQGQAGTPSAAVRTSPQPNGLSAADRLVQQYTEGGFTLQQGADMLRRNGVGAVTGEFGPSKTANPNGIDTPRLQALDNMLQTGAAVTVQIVDRIQQLPVLDANGQPTGKTKPFSHGIVVDNITPDPQAPGGAWIWIRDPGDANHPYYRASADKFDQLWNGRVLAAPPDEATMAALRRLGIPPARDDGSILAGYNKAGTAEPGAGQPPSGEPPAMPGEQPTVPSEPQVAGGYSAHRSAACHRSASVRTCSPDNIRATAGRRPDPARTGGSDNIRAGGRPGWLA